MKDGTVEVDSIPQPAPESAAQIESADLVVGVFARLDRDGMNGLYESLRSIPRSLRIVVLQNDPANAATGNSDSAQGNASLSVVSWSSMAADPTATVQSISAAGQSLFAATEKLGARACCLVASEMQSAPPEWVCELLQPLVESNADLVVPYYTPRKLQGLLNTSILYPLTRSLYGKRIHNPLGPDVGVSRRLAQKMLGANHNGNSGAVQMHPLASLTPVAVCESLQVCEAHVGARVYPPTDWTTASSLVAQVLGPVFQEMERCAAAWQKARGSVPLPARGEAFVAAEDTGSPDLNLSRMVETFQLGVRDLQEIWSLVLPPATLFELRKLSRMKPEQVSMPDDLWARIIYDFALAHRLRTINRDHLLRSMTPLYLAWVASYARDLEHADAAAVEQRIERLSLAYEAYKPYLISRWRWPDRFNP
jgi:hypothetical protein